MPNDNKLSFKTWWSTNPWGTTRGGLALRLAGAALATWAVVVFFSVTVELGNLFLIVVVAVLGVLFYVLPWLVERATTSPTRLPRWVDNVTVFPSLGLTLIAVLVVVSVGSAHVGVIIAIVQTVGILIALFVPPVQPAAE
ncbi:type III secretory pathway component EscS [Leifsonia sp. AK011]|uniref:hypothetical protein n=1 Tax=Leifsonia sp. AK011 TaxID=2723075 RepID=UPI0015C8606F|nr:hypothetical protein [Leifsonia sp. AK011]NYF11348.1 type III secretory pathway component EscS [Leifsonia sp. AK011]